MKLPLWRIAEFSAAKGGFEQEQVAMGYSIDSRTLNPGDLFMALKGDRFDGHDYVPQALERGAVAAIVEHGKAIQADARKLLVVVWHVLTKQVADREAVPERVAGKVLEWSWKVGRVNRRGLTTVAFVRRQLCRVQVGESLTTVSRGKKRLRLPPPEPVAHAVG